MIKRSLKGITEGGLVFYSLAMLARSLNFQLIALYLPTNKTSRPPSVIPLSGQVVNISNKLVKSSSISASVCLSPAMTLQACKTVVWSLPTQMHRQFQANYDL